MRSLIAALSARFFITFAVQLQSVLLGWQMYELTHDPFKLGLIGLAEAIPALSMALIAGHWVDRSRPVLIYRGLIVLVTLSLVVVMQSSSETGLYLSSIITGLARAFAGPSINTIVPKIVDRDQLPRAAALMTMVNRLALVLGPATSGVLLAWLGYTYAYGTGIGLAAIALLSTFALPKIPAPIQIQSVSLKESTQLALRYVWNHPILFPTITLDMFAVLFGGVTAILPAIASDILHVGSAELGLLRASPAVGAIIVTALLARFPIEKNAGRLLYFSVFGFGLCILGFAASRDLFLSILFLGMSGMFDSVSMVVRGTIMQLTSPDHMRGRIAAVNSMFIVSSNEIGAFESGMAASAMGLVPSIYFGGIMTLFVVVSIYRRNPKMWLLDLGGLHESPTRQ